MIPLPEGGGGPSRFPGDLRRDPVHPARCDLEVACGLGAGARGISEETGCGGGYANDRSRVASGLSLIRSEERVSRAALLHPVGGGHVGALRAARKGPSVQRWLGQLCLGVTCRSRAGSRLSPGVTAEAGRIRDVSESSGASPKRGSRQSLGSNTERVGVPLA